MATPDVVVVALNSSIVQVLCNGTGTLGEILASLQIRFPTLSWTESSLTDYIALGVREGRLRQVASDPARWQIRKDMGFTRPQNRVYISLCPSILTVPCKDEGRLTVV